MSRSAFPLTLTSSVFLGLISRPIESYKTEIDVVKKGYFADNKGELITATVLATIGIAGILNHNYKSMSLVGMAILILTFTWNKPAETILHLKQTLRVPHQIIIALAIILVVSVLHSTGDALNIKYKTMYKLATIVTEEETLTGAYIGRGSNEVFIWNSESGKVIMVKSAKIIKIELTEANVTGSEGRSTKHG